MHHENFPRSATMILDLNAGAVSEDRSQTILKSTTNLESSLETSSLATRANSAVLRGPKLHPCASTDKDHLDLSTISPLMSRNLGSLGSSTACYSLEAEQDANLRKRKQKEDLKITLQAELQKSLDLFIEGKREGLPSSSQMHKKNRLEVRQNASVQENIIQQLPPRQDSVQQYGQIQSPHSLVLQQELGCQKQQNFLQLQRVRMKPQLQQQLGNYLQQLALPVAQSMHPFCGYLCYRRLMQYMYHLRRRPTDNGIAYWRKFVAEYYASRAKKRWCLSSSDSAKLHAISVFSQAAMDSWHCDLCRTKFGRGFEATFETLPRLNKIQFESGVIDELLFLEFPREFRLPSGLLVLESGKAVHETVFDQLHVVREGKLRIIFTQSLKILSWEFCSRDHEELMPRTSILPEVNGLVHASQKHQAIIGGTGPTNISACDLQECCNFLLSTGRKLEKKLDSKLVVGDLGFPKRYIRCLQIADICNSMKDLMAFSWDNKIGPIESLKRYSQNISTTGLHKDEFQRKRGLQVPQGHPYKLSTSHSLSCSSNDNSTMSKDGMLNRSEGAALTLTTQGPYKRFSNISPSTSSQGPNTSNTEIIRNLAFHSFHSSEGGRHRQEHTVPDLLEEIIIRAENEAIKHKIDDIISKGKIL